MCRSSNIRGWHIVVGYLLALGIALLFLSSCATVAKKNEKAYQRVLTDSAMFRSIGQKFARLQPPCVSDTIIGETQVLILSDTQYVGNTDTLLLPDTIRITTTKTNTVTKYVVDNRAIHELQDTIHALQVREASNTGRLLQAAANLSNKEIEVKEQAKKANLWKWLFFIAIGLWGLRELSKIGVIRKIVGF